MTSVWKRLQRVGKRAFKFHFIASYQELLVECTRKWQPDKLIVVWTRRNRRVCSKPHSWQPGINNPYRGTVVWPVPENVDITVTLYKDPLTEEFEEKEWTFLIENNLLRMEFEQFKVTYNKNYDGAEEEENHFKIFMKNLEKARKRQEEDRGTAEYGVNKFSDMSDEEFDQFYFNPLMMSNSSWPQEADWKPDFEPMANRSVPRCWDWRRKGAVTSVKNQKTCRSCWAFAVTSNIESLWFLKTKRLISLSEQELVDCDHFSKGCRGGYPYSAFTCVMKLGCMMARNDYRYVARKGRCRFQRRRCVSKIKSYRNLRPHEYNMKLWVASRGPIVVIMNGAALTGYRRGIIRPNQYNCPCNRMTHAVTIIGYGIHQNIPYWIVKNSWGRDWGENGYFRIYRGEKACGINKYPSTAIV